jgi:hypothetical protein
MYSQNPLEAIINTIFITMYDGKGAIDPSLQDLTRNSALLTPSHALLQMINKDAMDHM